MPPTPPRPPSSARRAAVVRRRRRRGQMRLAGVVVLLVVVVVIAVAASDGSSGSRATDTAGSGAARSDPLTTTRLARYLSRRQGDLAAAVEDLRTGQEWVLNPREREQTASIVKDDILQAVLYRAQEARTPLVDSETDAAEGMIEASDDDDATDLYAQIGGSSGLDAYDARAGLTDTSAGTRGFWGETLTTAPDQIRLLRQLAVPAHSLLNAGSRSYQLSLMEDVDPGENWGVTGGVPATGVTVALKNGWVPLSSATDWQVNTTGWVDGDDHDYLLAALSAHDPSENYGIATLDQLSTDVYDTLGPAPRTGTPTIQVVPTD